MFITYWLIDSKGEMLSDADSIGDLKGLLGDLEPGRYTVDEISSKPLPSGYTARRWGVLQAKKTGRLSKKLIPGTFDPPCVESTPDRSHHEPSVLRTYQPSGQDPVR